MFGRKYVPLGGLASGFFGGLSRHQGALRSAFLLKSISSDKQVFIGTGVVCAVAVDPARAAVYGFTLFSMNVRVISEAGGMNLIGVAIIAAFAGSFAGSRLIKKVTLRQVRKLVGVMLLFIAGGLQAVSSETGRGEAYIYAAD